MTEQGERRINQPQCDPTGRKNSTPTSKPWGKGSTCNQGNLASCTYAGFLRHSSHFHLFSLFTVICKDLRKNLCKIVKNQKKGRILYGL
ncbi:hypothetical protein XELAEV_18012366mg [Xenopus laevis]|uniref:Uncharacterized protein n=1 Tax=Xenopus laevis TaxID=8355 RepID=A0A974DNY2_XENLA|nr:hypothetical protein XELAEV_18012366mg [Xenopus laevis]